jgi:hypothetical protein
MLAALLRHKNEGEGKKFLHHSIHYKANLSLKFYFSSTFSLFLKKKIKQNLFFGGWKKHYFDVNG